MDEKLMMERKPTMTRNQMIQAIADVCWTDFMIRINMRKAKKQGSGIPWGLVALEREIFMKEVENDSLDIEDIAKVYDRVAMGMERKKEILAELRSRGEFLEAIHWSLESLESSLKWSSS